jgi:hypothetical protein
VIFLLVAITRMQHIRNQTTIAGLQRKLGRHGIGHDRQGDLYIFRTSRQTMPNCFLRGLIVNSDLAVVCSPFCTSTVEWTDPYARTAFERSLECTENLVGVIVRLYYYSSGQNSEWRYATKSSTDLRVWNDGTSFRDIVKEALGGQDMPFERLDTELTYVVNVCHPKTIAMLGQVKPEVVHITSYRNGTMAEVPAAGIPGVRRPQVVERPKCLDGSTSLVYRIRKPDNDLYVVVLGRADAYRQTCGRPNGLYGVITAGETREFLELFPDQRERLEEMQSRVDRFIDAVVPLVEQYRRDPRSVPAQSAGIDNIVKQAARALDARSRSRDTPDIAVARALKTVRYEEVFPAEIEPSLPELEEVK